MGGLCFSFMISANLFFLFSTVSFAVDGIKPSQSVLDGTTLVSSDGSFELGFFSPGSSKNRYLGIWFKNVPVRTVVWVANRCNPINDSSGVLMINSTGNLVLLSQNSSVVWSTSLVKQAPNAMVELLDSGNLVLRDAKDGNSGTYLWQSFDYPSDTLLPGMKLGWDLRTGLKRHLSAWKSSDDPCPGDFTYGIEMELGAYPEAYILNGGTKFFRTSAWNGLTICGSPKDPSPRYSFNFVYNDDEIKNSPIQATAVAFLNMQSWGLWNEGKPLELIDTCLGSSGTISQVLRCIHIGLLCTQHHPDDRPSMADVVIMLGSETALAQPKQPGFFMERGTPEAGPNSGNQSCSINELSISLLEAR